MDILLLHFTCVRMTNPYSSLCKYTLSFYFLNSLFNVAENLRYELQSQMILPNFGKKRKHGDAFSRLLHRVGTIVNELCTEGALQPKFAPFSCPFPHLEILFHNQSSVSAYFTPNIKHVVVMTLVTVPGARRVAKAENDCITVSQ